MAERDIFFTKDFSSRFPPGKKRVAVHPQTNEFLHLRGTGGTADRNYAWVGTPEQFRNLVDKWPESRVYRLQRTL